MEFLFDLWKPVLSTLAVTLGGFFANRFVRSANDRNRAEILTRIADDAVSLVVMANPRVKDYAEIVRLVIERVRQSAPTTSSTVLHRVVSAAVERRVNRRQLEIE